MNLKQGDLYFIGERDVLNGTVSPYYKIGLVKESREGDSEDRVSEHQTGNPRSLFVHHAVTAPAVSDLEATMHDLHATSRILGEWFEFGDDGLASAIAVAESLAAEQRQHLEAFQAAVDLKGSYSSGIVREPSDDDRHWYAAAVASKVTGKAVSTLLGRSTKAFRQAQRDRYDVTRFVSVITKAPKAKFDKAAFKRAHPEVHDLFLVEKTVFRPKFDLKVPKEVEEATDLDPAVATATEEFAATVARAEGDVSQLEALHMGHLGMLRLQARADWDHEIAVANLKMLCGEAEGVRGLMSWRRADSTTQVFDAAAFGEQHPDLLAAFTVEEQQEAFRVLPMRSYALEAR